MGFLIKNTMNLGFRIRLPNPVLPKDMCLDVVSVQDWKATKYIYYMYI